MQDDSRKTQRRTALGDGIFKSKSGYEAKYVNPITGKSVGPVLMKNARNKTEAKKMREEIVKDLLSRKAFAKDESVSRLADRWLQMRQDALDDGNLAPRTYEADALRWVPTIKKHFGSMRVSAVTTEEVREFHRALRSGKSSLSGGKLAGKTRSNTLRALEQMFDMKIAEENGGFNPVRGLSTAEKPKQKRQREPIEMSPEATAKVLDLAKEWTPTYHPLFVLLATTGMRIEEALLTRWENVDTNEGWLEVTNGKQKRAANFVVVRRVPISADLKRVLIAHRIASEWSQPEHFVFAASAVKHKTYRNVRRALRRVSELAGYGPTKEEHLNCHDFRHSLCTNVRGSLRTDGEKLAFCRSLGWKDTTMFDRVYGQGRSEVEAMAELAADVFRRAGIGV
jgi:integrase